MASDCTGLATPELMWKMARMFQSSLPVAEHVWTCDISTASRAWIRKVLPQVLILDDMSTRTFERDAIVSEDVDGNKVRISRMKADLDLYITGFMCSPFSSAGDRAGWSADATVTFFNAVKTILVMQPRAVILENVPQVASKKNFGSLMETLSSIKNYRWKFLMLRAQDFGIPQDRDRYYIVGLLDDNNAQGRLETVRAQVHAMKVSRSSPGVTWPVFLSNAGLPIARLPLGSGTHLAPCGICDNKNARGVCPEHPCNCQRCKLHGTKARTCMWRGHAAKWHQVHRHEAHKYLATWRSVKKNVKLKAAPSYYMLGEIKNIRVPDVMQTSPRVRSCLLAWSSTRNLMTECMIVNSSQGVDRSKPRDDGLVPTLTTSCGRLFAPKHGCFLSPSQCLALQGIDPKTTPHDDFSENMLYTLAGMGMTGPVVGSVMTAVIGQLPP